MANRELNLSVGAETTLASSATSGATSLSVTSSSGFPAVDFAVVLDPGDDSKREVIVVTNVSGTTWTVTRGQDGTSGAAHDSGAVAALVPVPSLWGDLHDRVEAHQHGGGTDGAAVDHGSLSGLGDFTADHGTAHDAHDHSTALGTATLGDLSAAAVADLDDHNKANHDSLSLDHGSLSGLADDDHPNLLNETRHDALDHSGLTGIPVVVASHKSADETVNNSTTLQDDNHLTASLEASSTYIFTAFLDIDGSAMSGALPFKFGFSTPSGSTLTFSPSSTHSVATGSSNERSGDPSARESEFVAGRVVTAGSAGSLTLRWAQQSAEAANLVLKAGSWLRVEKVA